MNNWLYSFFILALVACTSPNDQPVDLEEIMPKAAADKQPKKVETEQKQQFTTSLNLELLKENAIHWDSVSLNEDLTIPERFASKQVEKFDYWLSGKPITYLRWSFKDSTKSMNAFLNWMNCFGKRCSMVEIGKKTNIQKTNLLILQNDTCIIQLHTLDASLNELKKWKKIYLLDKESKWNFILMQSKFGKVEWTNYVDEKEEIIAPTLTK
jgi:hypothetical protein